MQNRLEQAELEVKKLEEQQRQNEREMQELQGYSLSFPSNNSHTEKASCAISS
jgi:hypothetical protein